jgi:hypothetical protein
MANTTDDWLYNDDLEVPLTGRGRLDTDTQGLDGEDLLDDMLTAPSSATHRTDTPTNEDELLGVPLPHDTADTIIEGLSRAVSPLVMISFLPSILCFSITPVSKCAAHFSISVPVYCVSMVRKSLQCIYMYVCMKM